MHVEAVDGHRPGLALHLDALPGQGVEAAAAHLHRRDHGRDLLDVPGQDSAAASRTSARVTSPMSQVPVTSPAASRVEVAVPSTTSAS